MKELEIRADGAGLTPKPMVFGLGCYLPFTFVSRPFHVYTFSCHQIYKAFPLWILLLLPCSECSFLPQDPIVTSIVSRLHIISFESYSIALVCV